ncbi:DUF1998 domain-containing protein [Desulfosarcina ovata]|uniref:MrfA-like Zn-binding domain-containing protein n=1 Tax=Desulfosarcina ovata subsp. ovata TaxID=2752305 RepID=A0A5K8AEQ2_9BACT|nr:DUF1998 domain-containing protein [Desulfosarcina ovata]BBO91019.1 hypothetical protein DSCOOX_41990 [Desulfosarcina ovata subsp. ovata]
MTDPTPIRLSHLIGFCAPGAIVRSADMLMVPMDTRYWTQNGQPKGGAIVRVKRLQVALGIGDRPLHFPPTGRMEKAGRIVGDTLPAVRFPRWMHCEHCGRLYYRLWRHPSDQDLYCTHPDCRRKARLAQVPWALVHPNGYLDDIPWFWLAHRAPKGDVQRHCKDRDSLVWKENTLRCDTCGAHNKFWAGELTGEKFFYGYRWMQQQPWLRERVPVPELEQTLPVAREIGDVRIYEAHTARGLVIPPESRITDASPRVILEGMPAELDLLRTLRAKNAKQFGRKLANLARKLRFAPEALVGALDEIDSALDTDPPFSGDLLGEEFKALTTPIPDLREEEDFITEHFTTQWHGLAGASAWSGQVARIIGLVDRVVAVNRLREIVVYKGFERPAVAGPDIECRLVPPDIVGRQNWLPGLELFGEGIFISLKEAIIGAWEQNEAVIRRCHTTARRLENHGEEDLPRYMLLHTLAHLMIRQIEFDSGYPAAALKERLYARRAKGPDAPMAGILVYTAVPDVAGSLGGLVELARPERLLAILERAFTHAEWCALDPVCAEHDGQGPQLLNRAACHACTLLPEPSCEVSEAFGNTVPANTLLDRALIKGVASGGEEPQIAPLLEWVG